MGRCERRVKVSLTRRYYIRAVHTLPSEVDEQGRLLVHGHDCALDITVSGELNKSSGLIIDREQFDHLVNTTIINEFDAKNLNRMLKIPSGENLSLHVWQELQSTWLKPFLSRLEIQETAKNAFILAR